MEYVPNRGSDVLEPSAPDPCSYVRQADLALLDGDRQDAVAQAYVAFDLVCADCCEVTGPGSAWPGRSS